MIVNKISEILKPAFVSAGYEIGSVKIKLSNRPDLCDFQCDDAFALAKTYKSNPATICQNVIDQINNMEKLDQYFDAVSFVAPGFINITLSSQFINQEITAMNNNANFNLPNPEKRLKFVVDYGGPNIAKPLHVGHLRSAVVGESINRILKFAGHETISDVYLGDWGLQIGQVIYGLKMEGVDINNITLKDLEYIYPKYSALCKEDEAVRDACAEITKLMQHGDQEYRRLHKIILQVSGDDIRDIYNYLDVRFDIWEGESNAYEYIPETKQVFEDRKLLETSDGGALIINVKKDSDTGPMPPVVFQKSNGAYLYGTNDIASIYRRVKLYNPTNMVYVVDKRQTLHFDQVFRASVLGGFAENIGLEHCGFGTVNGQDGKPYKSRDGNTPKLRELFEQVKQVYIATKVGNENKTEHDLQVIVNAIIKFADLQNFYGRDYVFDIAKFSNIVGKTGPYLLYSYMRVQKILDNEKALSEKPNDESAGNELNNTQLLKISKNNDVSNIFMLSSIIHSVFDKNLKLKLLELPEHVNNAFTLRDPSKIADYVYDLATLANAFYENHRIASEEDAVKKQDLISILTLTNKVIKQMLNLLAINVPQNPL